MSEHAGDGHPRGSADRRGTPLVEWDRVGRRMRRSATWLLSGALLAWLAVGLATGGPRLAALGNYLGAAVGLMFAVELVVVGGSALRGMFRAGQRGERLAGRDVALLPPQVLDRGED